MPTSWAARPTLQIRRAVCFGGGGILEKSCEKPFATRASGSLVRNIINTSHHSDKAYRLFWLWRTSSKVVEMELPQHPTKLRQARPLGDSWRRSSGAQHIFQISDIACIGGGEHVSDLLSTLRRCVSTISRSEGKFRASPSGGFKPMDNRTIMGSTTYLLGEIEVGEDPL
jgi:hypothetical protein